MPARPPRPATTGPAATSRPSRATGRPGHALPLDEVGSTAYRTRNHTLAIAHRGGNHLVEAKFGLQDMPYQLYPNQRMDLLDNSQQRVNLRYLGSFAWGSLEARAYHEKVEHFMDFGDDKRYWYGPASGGPTSVDGTACSPVGATCAAGMPMYTESRTTGLTVKADLGLGEGGLARVGGEYQGYRLDDWWPPSGGGMWPDTFWNVRDGTRDRAALFAEWETRASDRWLALAGVRYERVETDTGPVQAYNNAVAPATTLVPAFNGLDRARPTATSTRRSSRDTRRMPGSTSSWGWRARCARPASTSATPGRAAAWKC